LNSSKNLEEPRSLLEVKELVKYFPVLSKGILRTKQVASVHACDNVSFDIKEGETLGLVGESGCGKTTVARTILNLVSPTSGEVYFDGKNVFEIFNSKNTSDILDLRSKMQLVFQNPYTSLNPRMSVKDIITEPFKIHENVPKEKMDDRLFELLEMVGLEPYHANRYPHEFSGGQRQRIGIARVLAVEPKFLILDEPVASLDMSIRSQILKLLSGLQRKMKLTSLYISHDLNSVMHISNKVAVMYLGKLMEVADPDVIFKNSKNPYTQALMSAIPVIDPKTKRKKIILKGEVPSAINPPQGCRFHPRCNYAFDKCSEEEPKLKEIKKEHMCACHLA
jgi:oligopeptide/dipeptide ABC transporter ATP-binding protein